MDKFALFPLKDIELWAFYKKQVGCFWTPEEVDMSQDIEDWKKLTNNERSFIKHVLGFFAVADGVVVENLALNFCAEVESAEARCFYGFQVAIENIHAEMYSLMIDALIENRDEKNNIFNAIATMPVVENKVNWITKWMDRSNTFQQRLVAFACVEGIFFSSSFCAIFWLKKRGLMPGLGVSNEFISRDEGLHCDFACCLYSKFPKLDQKEVYEIVSECVNLEIEFVQEALKCDLIGTIFV